MTLKEVIKTEIFVITGSVTYAMKALDLLKKKKIPAKLKRQQNNENRIGCGYGVETYSGADEVLKQNGIKILAVKPLKKGL